MFVTMLRLPGHEAPLVNVRRSLMAPRAPPIETYGRATLAR
jgi:hypothetical protein